MVGTIQAHMAPATSRSLVVTGFPFLIVGHGNLAQPVPQVGQVPDNGKDGHEFGADGDAEPGGHHEPVHLSADPHDDVPQPLGAEVYDPAHFHVLGVDVQTFQPPLGQLFIRVIGLVLHPGVEGHHGQIMGIHDGVDVPGETHGKFGQGNRLGIASAGRAPLDIHGGPTRRLTDATPDILLPFAQSLDEPHRGGGFPFPQGGGGDGRHFDVLAIGFFPQAVDDLHEIKSSHPPVGDDFILFQPQLFLQIPDGLHVLFGRLRDLPVGHLYGIVWHTGTLLFLFMYFLLMDFYWYGKETTPRSVCRAPWDEDRRSIFVTTSLLESFHVQNLPRSRRKARRQEFLNMWRMKAWAGSDGGEKGE